jgi:hypothetical protein
MKSWFIARFKERSTWVGIITLVAAMGWSLSPEQKEMVITLGTTLIALVLTFTKDPQSLPSGSPGEPSPKE